jgi:hypothetical protein
MGVTIKDGQAVLWGATIHRVDAQCTEAERMLARDDETAVSTRRREARVHTLCWESAPEHAMREVPEQCVSKNIGIYVNNGSDAESNRSLVCDACEKAWKLLEEAGKT